MEYSNCPRGFTGSRARSARNASCRNNLHQIGLALANYEQALTEARAKAGAIAKATRDKMTAEIEAERAKVDAQITAKLTEAENRIAETKSKGKKKELAGAAA